MTQQLPSAQIYAVRLHRDGSTQLLGRVTVRCPFCTQLHAHRIFADDPIVFTRTAPCGRGWDSPGQQYSIDLNVDVPRRDVSQLHPVYETGELASGSEHLNDNAIDVPVPNWEE